MSILDAIIQGIVQGLTEFLPVSSSGHLSLVQHFTGTAGESSLLFSLFLHVGTILAVVVAFRKTLWALIKEFCVMIKDIFTGKFSFKGAQPKRRMIFLLVVATLPMCVFYFARDFFGQFSTDEDIVVEGICFLITSVLLFMACAKKDGKKTAANMRYRDAVAIGVMQGVAALPGVSRSGSTISTGVLCGLNREFAVSFSFIMGLPVILAASLVEAKDAVGAGTMSIDPVVILVGVVVSAVVGYLAIALVRWFMKSNHFKLFAYYTLILGLFTVVIGVIEKF